MVAQRWFFHLPSTTPTESEWLREAWNHPPTIINTLRQCFFVQSDGTLRLVPQDWTLGIELIGSFLIPFFIFLARWNTLALLGIAGIPLASFHAGAWYLAFVCGVLLAKHHNYLEQKIRGLTFFWKMTILFLGLVLYQSRLLLTFVFAPGGRIVVYLISAGCVLIILMSLFSKRIQKTLNHPVATFFGRISYSVYLVQFIILLCPLPRFIEWLNTFGITRPIPVMLLGLGFSVLATTLLATISYYLVELPAIRLGRRLAKWIERRRQKKPIRSSS